MSEEYRILNASENISFKKKICDCFGGHTVLPQNDINSRIRPKKILRNEDGSLRFVCGRCETTFSKAPRCPECGQLVKL